MERFWMVWSPQGDAPTRRHPNRAERIAEELGDLLGVVQQLYGRKIIKPSFVDRAMLAKREKLRRYLQSTAALSPDAPAAGEGGRDVE